MKNYMSLLCHQLQFLPWMNGRPYLGGDLYNCLMMETIAQVNNDSVSDLVTANIGDTDCKVKFLE